MSVHQNLLRGQLCDVIQYCDRYPNLKLKLLEFLKYSHVIVFEGQKHEVFLSSIHEVAQNCCNNPELVEKLNFILPSTYALFKRHKVFDWSFGYLLHNWQKYVPREITTINETETVEILTSYFFHSLDQKYSSFSDKEKFISNLFSFYDIQNRIKCLACLKLDLNESFFIELIIILDKMLSNLSALSLNQTTEYNEDLSIYQLTDPDFEDLFSKIYSVCDSQSVYENFIRCIDLYNERKVSKPELARLVLPFLKKQPEIWSLFLKLLNLDPYVVFDPNFSDTRPFSKKEYNEYFEFDFLTSKRFGSSYRLLRTTEIVAECPLHGSKKPRSYKAKNLDTENQFSCEKLKLCKCKVNKVWNSFPSWSEASWQIIDKPTSLKSRQHLTKFTDYLNKIEDDRYELDMIILNNISAIKLLERFQSIILDSAGNNFDRINAEMKKFMLNLPGERAYSVEKWAISRIYGSKFFDIMEGIQNNPYVAIPVVLRRLQEKHCEWKHLKETLNGVWKHLSESFTKKHNVQLLANLNNVKLAQFKKSALKVLKNELEVQEAELRFKLNLKSLNKISNQHHANTSNVCFPVQNFEFEISVLKLTADLVQISINDSAFGQQKFPIDETSNDSEIVADFDSSLSSFMKYVCKNLLFVDTEETSTQIGCEKVLIEPEARRTTEKFICNFQWYTVLKFIYQLHEIFEKAITKFRKNETNSAHENIEVICHKIFSICTGFLLGATDANGFESSIASEFGSEVYIELACVDKVMSNFVKFLNTVWNSSNCLNLLSLWAKFSNEDVSSEEIWFIYFKDCLNFFTASERIFEAAFVISRNKGKVEVKHWKRDFFDQIRKIAEEKCVEEEYLNRYLNFHETRRYKSDEIDDVDDHRKIGRSPVFLKRNVRKSAMPSKFYFNDDSSQYFGAENNSGRKRIIECTGSSTCFYVPKIYFEGCDDAAQKAKKRKRAFDKLKIQL